MTTVLPILIPKSDNVLLLKDDVGQPKPTIYKLPDQCFRYGRRQVHEPNVLSPTNTPQTANLEIVARQLPSLDFRYGRKNKFLLIVNQTFNSDEPNNELFICQGSRGEAECYLQIEARYRAEKAIYPKYSFIFITLGIQHKEKTRKSWSIQDEAIYGRESQILIMIAIISRIQSLTFASQFSKVTLIDQPKMKRRSLVEIKPPGMNLQVPDWPVDKFMLRIGKGCSEYADKFESLKEVFDFSRHQMKEKGVPPVVRRYLFSVKEQLRRGVLTFEYLERRVVLEKEKKKKN